MAAQDSKVYYTRHSGGLTIYIDGKSHTVSSTAPQFARILEALKAKDYAKAKDLMNLGSAITALGISRRKDGQKVYVEKGRVFWLNSHKKPVELHGTLVKRILNVIGKPQAEKFADALINFLDNVMKNTVKDIREELYEFLMSGDAPITYDGCFLAYKKVRSNFTDGYSGKMDNSPGKIVRLPQDQVDKNRANECSSGLHFASLGYLPSFGTGGANTVVIVKVNPRHVFAIPRDYNCQKGRCSEYYVVGQYHGGEHKEAFRDSFIDEATKEVAAPDVSFVKSLTASLEARALSHDLIVDHPVYKAGAVMIVYDNKGRMVPVKKKVDGKRTRLLDIKGFEWVLPDGVEPDLMSVKTNTVRQALKKALAAVEKK